MQHVFECVDQLLYMSCRIKSYFNFYMFSKSFFNDILENVGVDGTLSELVHFKPIVYFDVMRISWESKYKKIDIVYVGKKL